MGNLLAILDEEAEYVCRLLRYFNSKKGKEFEAAAFTNEESFRQYEKKHEIDLLVCEEMLYKAMAERVRCPTLLLSSTKRVREGEDIPVIYKYQSAKDIFDEIVRYYREKTPVPAYQSQKREAKIFTVCSAAGGRGVSTLAYTLAKKKAKANRTVFLSLDPFYLPEKAQADGSGALTEAIYFIRQNSAKFSERLKLKTVERVDCLYGVAHWADLCDCTGEDAAKLLEGILQVEPYEFVVVDAGAFTALSAGCIALADKVILISEEGRKAQGKEQEFMRQIKLAAAEIEERLFRVARQPVEIMAEEVFAGVD